MWISNTMAIKITLWISNIMAIKIMYVVLLIWQIL